MVIYFIVLWNIAVDFSSEFSLFLTIICIFWDMLQSNYLAGSNQNHEMAGTKDICSSAMT